MFFMQTRKRQFTLCPSLQPKGDNVYLETKIGQNIDNFFLLSVEEMIW